MPFRNRFWGWEMHEAGSGSCSVIGFGISYVETPSSANRGLIKLYYLLAVQIFC
jgi:hypothetical protein